MSTNIDLGTKLSLITDYYGVGTIWDRMSIDGLSSDQINAMYDSLPASSFTVDRTPSGSVLGRSYNNPFELPTAPGSDFDSNIPGGSYGGGNTFSGEVPANIVTDPNTGLPVRQTAGATTSTGTTLPTIVDRVSLAVTGANIGAKLGLKIAETLYNTDPKWWDNNLPGMNPETWNSLVGISPVGDFFLRTLFGITGNQMNGYINADVLAYYYQMLRDEGIWGSGGTTYDHPELLSYPNGYTFPIIPSATPISIHFNSATGYQRVISGSNIITVAKSNSLTRNEFCFISLSPIMVNGSTSGVLSSSGTTSVSRTPYTIYYFSVGSQYMDADPGINVVNIGNNNIISVRYDIANILIDGITSGGVDGVNQMPDSTQYPPTNITGTTPQQVKQQLQQAYPDLFTDAITEKTMQPDGTITETTYVPIPWVTDYVTGDEATTGDGKTQTDTDLEPDVADKIIPTSTPDEPTQPPDTGTGETPTPVLPTGSASSLWAIYNPTQSELNSFGSWLWSSNFVDQLKKLFNDPMQAIIGVHKVFATPETGSSATIKCGYLDSGVSAATVTDQYTTVDCGSASMREYFGNVFDYDPFTKVSLFLPFIGIVPLNTYDVMRSTISVKYKVDVLTGACLAEVSVSRDMSGGIIYTYSGSCIVSYPLSSGSYVGVVQAALSTAIGVGMTIASGGATAGLLAGSVVSGLSHAKTNVQHSGQFSGSSGAMGGKMPYLIVSRPQTHTPSNINLYLGLPSYSTGKVSQYTGFTKFREIHFESDKAFSNELNEINNLLKSGIII